MYALFSEGQDIESILVFITFALVLVVLNAVGTILSFRHGLILAVTLPVPYLAWAFSINPFPGSVPHSLS